MNNLFKVANPKASKCTERPYRVYTRQQPRSSRDSGKDVLLDFNAEPRDVIASILENLAKKDGVSKSKRLAYLNSFVKYMQYKRSVSTARIFDVERACICLRVSLIQENPVIRVAALRVLRHLITTAEDVETVNSLGIPTLIVRSLDVVLNNAAERVQAVRFCQKILAIPSGAKLFPVCVTRALISIGFDGQLEHDKLHRSSLSLLCQLALLNPMQFIECGGVRVLLHSVFSCNSPMVLEGILGSLIYLLNFPETRSVSAINLQGLVAPLTDLHFKHTGHQHADKEVDEREMGYRSSKLAIEILLRSWGGLGSFCSNGIKALIDSLYIEQFEIRRTILDLLCEIIGLDFPTWTDEVSVAVSAVDPSYPQNSWKLQEGFVVEEALSVLPHLASFTSNITANHTGLLILCLVRNGLLEALVEVVLTSDKFLSVRATVLLGELLSLCDHLLPIDCFDPSQSIPSLLEHGMGISGVQNACSSSAYTASLTPQLKQQRAMEAITVLSLLHDIKARIPRASSMFLQLQILFAGYQRKNTAIFLDRLGEVKLQRILRKEVDSNPAKLLKETQVLGSKDPMAWNWEAICCLLKWCPVPLKRIEDSSWRLFLKRLLDFFKPSSTVFDRIELDHKNSNLFVQVGCSLIEFLAVRVQNFSGSVLLEEIVVDIAVHLDDLIRQKHNPHLALWNPTKLETTLSQAYFLFIGKLSQTPKSILILQKAEILQRLVEVAREVRHDDYAKLIISSLYYGEEYSRKLLGIVLSTHNERTRLYATKFLRILVRVKPNNFSKWGAELLIKQLGDASSVISLTALDILEEAIHDKLFLESLIALRPSFAKLGDRGLLLQISFTSLPSGFKYLQEANMLEKEIKRWKESFNKRYAEVVEVLIRDAVSTLRRGEDGEYPERATQVPHWTKRSDIFIPVHLYGQISQHKAGLDLLTEQGDIHILIDTVSKSICGTADERRELKGALWALSHFSTSTEGLCMLEENEVIESMVNLGKTCPTLSVRHTVFHCLCVVASTHAGAGMLQKQGWYTMPRNHHESYPVWGSSLPTISPSVRRLRELDLDIEHEEEASKAEAQSYLSTSPRGDSSNTERSKKKSWLKTGASAGGGDADVVDSAGLSLTTPKHSFSRSIRKRLSSFASSRSAGNDENFGDDVAELLNSSSRNLFDGKMTKSRSESSSEGKELEDNPSQFPKSPLSSPSTQAGEVESVQTLSPIPSSGSLSTMHVPRHPSISSSYKESSSSAFEEFFQERIPSIYRSVIRRPIIRIPNSADADIFPLSLSPQRRMSLREMKTGSLDRHIQLTPRDLFNESKLKRVNTSLTSLSTPSYRSRQEGETKGPCYMGLCLPNHLNMILLIQSTTAPLQTHISLLNQDTARPLDDSLSKSEFRTPLRQLVRTDRTECMKKVHDEILRLITSMISCIGVKSSEQGLLRLKQKYPKGFQDIATYCDMCDLLSEYNVRLPLRRFLQELFLDLSYDEIYEAGLEVLTDLGLECKGRHPAPLASTSEGIEEQAEVEKEMKEEVVDSDYIDLK